ncbi:hypothetical protein E2C01_010230 [Portunus trituberculatus]|uniref:Uncharacterized protein n=1 Tax=Portunus trituberculatus TaxID=210409 RepID=A0A5B7D849_PORTR|nr:hypothetical protein [Portunus trituberculatus]
MKERSVSVYDPVSFSSVKWYEPSVTCHRVTRLVFVRRRTEFLPPGHAPRYAALRGGMREGVTKREDCHPKSPIHTTRLVNHQAAM